MNARVLGFAADVADLGAMVLKMAPRPDQPDHSNPYRLPAGRPIDRLLAKWFRRQLKWMLGTLPTIGAPLPRTLPTVTDWTDPMARAMTPLLSAYWDEGGKATRARLGLDPDGWRVADPHLRKMVWQAAYNFCDATNRTTDDEMGTALHALHEEFTEGLVERGETLPELTGRVKSVFRRAERYRAERIAATEASRAVHAAGYQSAAESGVAVGAKWLASADCCEKCQEVAERVNQVRLGERFAVSGKNPTYRDVYHPPLHPNCSCSINYVLDENYGGPAEPQWGRTLTPDDEPDHA